MVPRGRASHSARVAACASAAAAAAASAKTGIGPARPAGQSGHVLRLAEPDRENRGALCRPPRRRSGEGVRERRGHGDRENRIHTPGRRGRRTPRRRTRPGTPPRRCPPGWRWPRRVAAAGATPAASGRTAAARSGRGPRTRPPRARRPRRRWRRPRSACPRAAAARTGSRPARSARRAGRRRARRPGGTARRGSPAGWPWTRCARRRPAARPRNCPTGPSAPASRSASRRAKRENLRGLPNDSRCSTASRVRSSPCHHSSMSLPLTSYLSPVDTAVDTPRPSRRSSLLHRDRDPAGLGDQADRSGGCRLCEGRVEPHRGVGVGDAEAVRPDHPHVVAADRVEQAPGEHRVAGQAGADHQQCPHPLAPALLGHRGTAAAGTHSTARSTGSVSSSTERWQVTPHTWSACGFTAARRPVKPARTRLCSTAWPDRVRPAARADDHHRAWREDRDQACDVRALLARGEGVQVALGRVEVELDVHLTVVDEPQHRQADVGQHLPDALVLGQHVRDEPAHAARGPGTPGAPAGASPRRAPAPCAPPPARPRPSTARPVLEALRHTDQRLAAERAQRHVGRPPRRDRSSAAGQQRRR